MDEYGIDIPDKEVVRIANLLILKKVWDVCTPKEVKMDEFYERMGISRSSVDKIIDRESASGVRWDTYKAAKTFGIDEEVLLGEKLLIIEGDSIKAIREEYDRQLNHEELTNEGRDKLRRERDKNTSEHEYWKYILQYKEPDKNDIWQNSKNVLLREVGKQAKNPDFNDVNLWKFWYHIKDIKK